MLQNWVIRVLLLLTQTESCRIRKTFRTASGSRMILPRLQSTLNAWLSPASVLIWLLHMQDSEEKICLSGPEACLGALAARRVLEIEFLACQALCTGRPSQCVRNEWASSVSAKLPLKIPDGPDLTVWFQEKREGNPALLRERWCGGEKNSCRSEGPLSPCGHEEEHRSHPFCFAISASLRLCPIT